MRYLFPTEVILRRVAAGGIPHGWLALAIHVGRGICIAENVAFS